MIEPVLPDDLHRLLVDSRFELVCKHRIAVKTDDNATWADYYDALQEWQVAVEQLDAWLTSPWLNRDERD